MHVTTFKVVRKTYTEISTIGDMLIDGNFHFYTLEDKDRQHQPDGTIIPWEPKIKVSAETAISYGSYRMIVNYSPKYKRVMPIIQNVPDFKGVRVHVLNFAHESEGCIGVGYTKSKDFIGRSRDAFKSFYELLLKALSDGGYARLVISNEEIEAQTAADQIKEVIYANKI